MPSSYIPGQNDLCTYKIFIFSPNFFIHVDANIYYDQSMSQLHLHKGKDLLHHLPPPPSESSSAKQLASYFIVTLSDQLFILDIRI